MKEELERNESAELQDFEAIKKYELELLEKLKAGSYEIVQELETGELCNELHRRPGLNRMRLWWDFDNSPVDLVLVNVLVVVDGNTFMHDGLLDEWVNEDLGYVIDEVEEWLDNNIDVDYSTMDKLFKLIVPNEEAADDYINDLDHYEIDSKLYFYAPEDIADEPFTDAKRKADEEMLARAKKLTHQEAVERFLAGDYELIPEEEF